ncbi:MAG: response regulator transcription factor [Sphingorhabdus sp.]
MRVLLVEDDDELGRRLTQRLQSAGIAVDCARHADEARLWPDIESMTAIILDLGLPDGDGLDLLRYWRAKAAALPILILTARGGWRDKVEGLNAGADDFLVKPVRFEELLARIHAMCRRHDGRATSVLTAGNLSLDPVGKIVTLGGCPLSLSRKEFNLLHLFLRRPGHIHSQADLVEQLYALEAERDHNAVEAHISRLRRKVGKERIQTMRSMGYRFIA